MPTAAEKTNLPFSPSDYSRFEFRWIQQVPASALEDKMKTFVFFLNIIKLYYAFNQTTLHMYWKNGALSSADTDNLFIVFIENHLESLRTNEIEKTCSEL